MGGRVKLTFQGVSSAGAMCKTFRQGYKPFLSKEMNQSSTTRRNMFVCSSAKSRRMASNEICQNSIPGWASGKPASSYSRCSGRHVFPRCKYSTKLLLTSDGQSRPRPLNFGRFSFIIRANSVSKSTSAKNSLLR